MTTMTNNTALEFGCGAETSFPGTMALSQYMCNCACG